TASSMPDGLRIGKLLVARAGPHSLSARAPRAPPPARATDAALALLALLALAPPRRRVRRPVPLPRPGRVGPAPLPLPPAPAARRAAWLLDPRAVPVRNRDCRSPCAGPQSSPHRRLQAGGERGRGNVQRRRRVRGRHGALDRTVVASGHRRAGRRRRGRAADS